MAQGRDMDVLYSVGARDAGFSSTLDGMNGGAETLFKTFTSGATKSMSVMGAFQSQLQALLAVQQSMVAESREFIALSMRFDIPAEKMGLLRKTAQEAGIHMGQLVRGLRGLDRNISEAMKMPGGSKHNVFAKLGLGDPAMLKAMSEDTSFALEMIRKSLRAIPDEAERNAAGAEALGQNWSQMIPYIEASDQALKDAGIGAHKYTKEGLAAATSLANMTQDMMEDLKPLAEVLTSVFGILQMLVSTATQGIFLLVGIIKDNLTNSFLALGGVVMKTISVVVPPIMKAYTMFKALTGQLTVKEVKEEMAAADALGKKASESGDEKFAGVGKNLNKSAKRIDEYRAKAGKNMDRAGMFVDGLSASMGGDPIYMDSQREKYKQATEEEARMRDAAKQVAQRQNELNKKSLAAGGSRTAADEEEYKKLEKQYEYYTQQQKLEMDRKNAAKESIDRFNAASGGDRDLQSGKSKFESKQLQDQRLAQEQKKRELDFKEGVANAGPLNTEQKSAMEVSKSYGMMIEKENKLKAIIEERNKVGLKGPSTPEMNALELEIQEAKIAFIEKDKAHRELVARQEKELLDSQYQRTEAAEEEMNRRREINLTRSGIVGREFQVNVVEAEAAKLRRVMENSERVMQSQFSSLSDREGAKAAIEKQLSSTMQAFDKLGGMQFNYTASDAAKKGMGGGSRIIDNPVDIAKSTRDLIKAQYELMLQNSQVNPYTAQPLQIKGGVLSK